MSSPLIHGAPLSPTFSSCARCFRARPASRCAMRWSSETTTGPDFHSLVENALDAGGPSPQGPGLMRMLDGNLPVYLCWVRDEAEQLIGIVAVVCRQSHDPDSENRGFSFSHSLLRPVLECLRRDL